MGRDQFGVQMAQEGDLVVAADRGEHRGDGRVGEGSHEIGGPVLVAGTDAPRGRELDRLDADLRAEPLHRQPVHVREGTRCREGRGQHGDPVSGRNLGRDAQVGSHRPI